MAEKPRFESFKEILSQLNSEQYRLKQIEDAIYSMNVKKYSEIQTLPKLIREKLIEILGDNILTLKDIYEITGDQVQKVLFETEDKHRIETVRMMYKSIQDETEGHNSLCVSSQSGCALNCSFCATGRIGFKKNLTVDEITDQVLWFKQKNLPIDSIVFMGMGEPFANPNTFDALKDLTDKNKFGMSQRRISVSTVGLVPGIERLRQEFPSVNLAFSLHSPFPDQRLQMMPITKAYPINVVMKSLREFVQVTNKKVFIAYILINNVNDSIDHAKAVGRLIKSQGSKSYLFHVNLIRYHPGAKDSYQKPTSKHIDNFMQTLTDMGVHNTLRQSFGLDIDAACGQLYGKYDKLNAL